MVSNEEGGGDQQHFSPPENRHHDVMNQQEINCGSKGTRFINSYENNPMINSDQLGFLVGGAKISYGDEAQSSGATARGNEFMEMQHPETDEDTSKEDSKSNGENRPPKRRRSAELHNLTERMRRQRIKDKMKTLQELIPNCNKKDKTSTLDDAINYIKTLQYQVQMMSKGAGFTMWHSPVLLPPQPGQQGVPISRLPPLLQTGPRAGVGFGYEMGMGIGMAAGPSSSINIPIGQFGLFNNPCSLASTTSGLMAFPGISNVHSFQNPDKDVEPSLFATSSDMSCAPFCSTSDPSFGSRCTTQGE